MFKYHIYQDRTYTITIGKQEHQIAGQTIFDLVEDFLLLYKKDNKDNMADGFTCKDCKFVFTKQFIESQEDFNEWHMQLHRRVLK